MMKIKDKKPFGEKHRLRRARQQQQQQRARQQQQQQRERTLKQLDEAMAAHLQLLEKNAWYQRIQALRPDDACEYYMHPEWRTSLFVRQSSEPATRWEVRDEQGRLLRVRCVRQPGDQEAWWGLGPHNALERDLAPTRYVEVIA
jgi:hypothetical protein